MNHFKVQVKEYDENTDTDTVTKEYIVKRVPRSKYREIELLQIELIEEFFVNNLSMGTTLKDDAVWDKMCTLSKMLPVVGKNRAGFNLTEIEDDLTQLGAIFFTTALTEDNTKVIPDDVAEKPSLIAKLHQLDLLLPIAEMGKRVQNRMNEKIQMLGLEE